MTDQSQQHPQVNLEEFSKKSIEFYNQIKGQLEKESLNKFVAVDYETSKYWLGETASEALSKAKAEFPQKIFYLIQVGSTTAVSIQSVTASESIRERGLYGFRRIH